MSIVAVAGSAFTYYLPGLEDQANPGLFKAAPTISAGDFTISINGGAFGALDNTPTVSPAGGTQIAIVLSAAETTAAGAGGRITVNCQDTAGAEWYSVGIAIPVQAKDISTFDGGTINSVSGTVTLADDGITADKLAASAIAEIAAAATGLTAQQVADAVNNLAPAGTAADGSIRDRLNDILDDTGITLPGLVSGLNGAVVEVVSAVSGGIITLYVADTWRFTVTSATLNLDGYEKLGLIVKANERQADDDALLYLRTDTNLVRVNGAAPVSAANGSLTKTTTSFAGLVAVAETQAVLSGDYRWWLKGLDTSPDPDEAITLAVGDFVLKSPGLRAVA